MIYVEDGFTVEMDSGIRFRPMLWNERKELLRGPPSVRDIERAIFGGVYCPEYPGLANEAVVIKAVLGYSKEAEAADFQSLNDTVQLQAVNPGLSLLQCGDCMKYSVDHSTGEIQRYPTGVPKTIPFGAKLPCQSFQGCLKGHWSAVRGLSNPRWAMTWRWYWSKQDIDGCPIQRRNRALMDWILLYGRNPGLNPFAVGAIDGGTAPVEPGRFVPIRKDGEGGK